jgi:hypothetical protein
MSSVTLLILQKTQYVLMQWVVSTNRKVAQRASLLGHARMFLPQTPLVLMNSCALVTLDLTARIVKGTSTNALRIRATTAAFARTAIPRVPRVPQCHRAGFDVNASRGGKECIVTTMWTNAKPHRAGRARALIRLQTRLATHALHCSLLTNGHAKQHRCMRTRRRHVLPLQLDCASPWPTRSSATRILTVSFDRRHCVPIQWAVRV